MINKSLRPISAVLSVAALAIGLAACSSSSSAGPEDSRTSSATSAGFPVTVENCGRDVTVEAEPQRLLLVNNDAVGTLEALDALPRVAAVTSTPQEGVYADATYDVLDDLGLLPNQANSTGGSIISQESILAAQPDLVIAPENAVDRDALANAGIPVYVPTAYCEAPGPELSQAATFDRVWAEVQTIGALLGMEDRAKELVAEGKNRLEMTNPSEGATAAALYVSSGGTVLSPYGSTSMVTPVFEAAGLQNVYADMAERVFDVNLEDLIARDPGTIVLLHSGGPEEKTLNAFLSRPGVEELSAVRQDRVVVLPFPYTDPPSMLTVQGPNRLGELLAEIK